MSKRQLPMELALENVRSIYCGVLDFVRGVHLFPLFKCLLTTCTAHGSHTLDGLLASGDLHWWISIVILVEVCVDMLAKDRSA